MKQKFSQELTESLIPNIQFQKRQGLCPVIVQEIQSKDILMLGYANLEAVEKTFASGLATFWSTSQKKIWCKGETSGNYLKVAKVLIDCDQDSLIYQVTLKKEGACHTTVVKDGKKQHRQSCFYRELTNIKKLKWLS